MKKRVLFSLLFVSLLAAVCFAQKPRKVMFYNLENFLDTINDPEVLTDEFPPEGPKRGDSAKDYKHPGTTARLLCDFAAVDRI